jgi:hypothetical protein
MRIAHGPTRIAASMSVGLMACVSACACVSFRRRDDQRMKRCPHLSAKYASMSRDSPNDARVLERSVRVCEFNN